MTEKIVMSDTPVDVILDLRGVRDVMVQAILDRHLKKSIDMYPDGFQIEGHMDELKRFNESYRPYAEADVDAIINVLLGK